MISVIYISLVSFFAGIIGYLIDGYLFGPAWTFGLICLCLGMLDEPLNRFLK